MKFCQRTISVLIALQLSACHSPFQGSTNLSSTEAAPDLQACESERANLVMLLDNTKVIPDDIFLSIVYEAADCMGPIELKTFLYSLQSKYVQLAPIAQATTKPIKKNREVAVSQNEMDSDRPLRLMEYKARQEHQRQGQLVSMIHSGISDMKKTNRIFGFVNTVLIPNTPSAGLKSDLIKQGAGSVTDFVSSAAIDLNLSLSANAARNLGGASSANLEKMGQDLLFLNRTDKAKAREMFIKTFYPNGMPAEDRTLFEKDPDKFIEYAGAALGNVGDLSKIAAGDYDSNNDVAAILGISNLSEETQKIGQKLSEVVDTQRKFAYSLQNLTSKLEANTKITSDVRDLMVLSNLPLDQQQEFINNSNLSPEIKASLLETVKNKQEYENRIKEAEGYLKASAVFGGVAQVFYNMGGKNGKTLGDIFTGGSLIANLVSSAASGSQLGGIGAAFGIMNFAMGFGKKKDNSMKMLMEALKMVLDKLQTIIDNQYKIMNQVSSLAFNMQVNFSNVENRLISVQRTMNVMHRILHYELFNKGLNSCASSKSLMNSILTDRASGSELKALPTFGDYATVARDINKGSIANNCGDWIKSVLDEVNTDPNLAHINKGTSYNALSIGSEPNSDDVSMNELDALYLKMEPIHKFINSVIYGKYKVDQAMLLGLGATFSATFPDYQRKLASLQNPEVVKSMRILGGEPYMRGTFPRGQAATQNFTANILSPEKLLAFVDMYLYQQPYTDFLFRSDVYDQLPDYLKNVSPIMTPFELEKIIAYLSIGNTQQNLISGEVVSDYANRMWGAFDQETLPKFVSETDFAKMVAEESQVSELKDTVELLLTNPVVLENMVRYRIYSIATMSGIAPKGDPAASNYTLGSDTVVWDAGYASAYNADPKDPNKADFFKGVLKGRLATFGMDLIQTEANKEEGESRWYVRLLTAKLDKNVMDYIQISNTNLVKAIQSRGLKAKFIEQTQDEKKVGARIQSEGTLEVLVPLPTPAEFSKRLFVMDPVVNALATTRNEIIAQYVNFKTYSALQPTARKEINWFRVRDLIK